jgi:hypothetical protein
VVSVLPATVAIGSVPATITATNSLLTGSVTVVKQIDAASVSASATTFPLDLSCGSPPYDQIVAVTVSAGATSGQSTIGELPAGMACTLAEPGVPAGWELEDVTPSAGVTVPAGGVATLTATNTRLFGGIEVSKTVTTGPTTVPLEVRFSIVCDDASYNTTVTVTVPPGDTSDSEITGGIPSGMGCTVTEIQPGTPWVPGGATVQAVTVPSGGAMALAAFGDALDGLTLSAKKTITSVVGAPATFVFLVVCDDPLFDQTLNVTVPAGSTTASAGIEDVTATVACTLTEASTPGWSQVSRSPSDGVAVGATPSGPGPTVVSFVNQLASSPPSAPTVLAYTGSSPLLPIGGGLLIGIGFLCLGLVAIDDRRRRAHGRTGASNSPR